MKILLRRALVFATTLVATLSTSLSLTAQCTKPAIPATGLATRTVADQALTYSDGYKTLVNLTVPSTTRPSCGWPLVAFVHGYGGRRTFQRAIASRGYAVVTYDVRGQGTAKTLNPRTRGMTFYGATEKYDLAEVIAFARRRWKGLVSPTKVAVTGNSQGGIHSWFAAAYSGRTLTIAGRGTIGFPKIDVAVPWNFIPDVADHGVRGRTLFAIDAIDRLTVSTAAILDPALKTQYRKFFLAQDPTGYVRAQELEPGRTVRPLLKTTRVPTLFAMAYIDGIQHPREAVPVLRAYPTTTPLQAILSTIGHGSPNNIYENAYRSEERIRWFDRFLWNEMNGAGSEARYVLGVEPVIRSVLTNTRTLWQHRHDDTYPAADVTTERWFMTSTGTLSRSRGAPGTTTIAHRVRSGYTASGFLNNRQLRQTNAILASIPLSSRVFRGPTLTKERELGGSPRVRLRVRPSAARFHLAALLFVRVPGQPRFMIASWGRGVIGAKIGTPVDLDFELAPSSCVLPKGASLELEIRNHWLRELPMPRRVVTAPYFVSCDSKIEHGGAFAASIDLPFRRDIRAGIVASRWSMTAQQSADTPLEIRGGSARAGKAYVTLASLSGQSPGLALPGGLMRLRIDPVTDLFLQLANGPILPAFVGTLDTNGRARLQARLRALAPLPRELVGSRFTYASWILDGNTSLRGAATNPVEVVIR